MQRSNVSPTRAMAGASYLGFVGDELTEVGR
jgi:hypothetical protein